MHRTTADTVQPLSLHLAVISSRTPPVGPAPEPAFSAGTDPAKHLFPPVANFSPIFSSSGKYFHFFPPVENSRFGGSGFSRIPLLSRKGGGISHVGSAIRSSAPSPDCAYAYDHIPRCSTGFPRDIFVIHNIHCYILCLFIYSYRWMRHIHWLRSERHVRNPTSPTTREGKCHGTPCVFC